jgi:hypothetical protein
MKESDKDEEGKGDNTVRACAPVRSYCHTDRVSM